MMSEAKISAYEGLVFSTAARYAPYLDDDLEDVAQVLRIKVWRALLAFDPARSRLGEKSYVFSCVRNQVKDLLKAQDSRNRLRAGAQAYVADLPVVMFDRLTSVSDDEVYGDVEDDELRLPSTLSELERQVVILLVLDYSQREIAQLLDIPRGKVRYTHQGIMQKMEDWRPSSAAVPALALAA